MKLDELDRLVGKSICTDRPRTAAEVAAWGEGSEGGCGLVVEVSPLVETVTLVYAPPDRPKVESTLTGRRIEFDWGMGELVTEDTGITEEMQP